MPLLSPHKPSKGGRPPSPAPPPKTAVYAFSLAEIKKLLHSQRPNIDTNELFLRTQLFFTHCIAEQILSEWKKDRPTKFLNADDRADFRAWQRLKFQLEQLVKWLSWAQRTPSGELRNLPLEFQEQKDFFDRILNLRRDGIRFEHLRRENILPGEGENS